MLSTLSNLSNLPSLVHHLTHVSKMDYAFFMLCAVSIVLSVFSDNTALTLLNEHHLPCLGEVTGGDAVDVHTAG